MPLATLIRSRSRCGTQREERDSHVTEILLWATSSPRRNGEQREGPMPEPPPLGDLNLAALVSSRICHDVINPVSAISNGLEMLAEEPDQAMREAAMYLIRKSAAQASAQP